jgi:2-oxo-4-hydroxy-4-carboxy--5-ureidoimidazoline (OHCU) decarboxylase
MNDISLDGLLAQVPAPPVPPGLAERVAAAATLLPQEMRPAQARRAAGRDRRGAWLRRPLIGGAIAFGLAFSGAVAATLAGVPLPAKVEAVIAQIPFVGHKAPEPERAPFRHAAARPAPRPAPFAPPAAESAAAEPAPMMMAQRPAAIRRMMLARRIVARREALGLPTPSVEQVQRILHRRQMMRRWRMATPEQREAFVATHPRAAAMIEAREARREPGAEQGEAYSEARPGPRARIAERLREATPEQREAFLAAHPRIRAMLEARRARREALAPEPR